MKTILITVGIVMLVMAGSIGFLIKKDIVQVSGQGDLGARTFTYFAGDVFGSKTGTTTIMKAWGGNYTATSSATKKIAGFYDQATFTISGKASTSDTLFYMSILGSNDDECDTASTTRGNNLDTVLVDDINWFDVGHHINGWSGSQTLNTGTTTFRWTLPGVIETTNTDFILEDLNYECLKFEGMGSSTEIWMQMKLK